MSSMQTSLTAAPRCPCPLQVRVLQEYIQTVRNAIGDQLAAGANGNANGTNALAAVGVKVGESPSNSTKLPQGPPPMSVLEMQAAEQQVRSGTAAAAVWHGCMHVLRHVLLCWRACRLAWLRRKQVWASAAAFTGLFFRFLPIQFLPVRFPPVRFPPIQFPPILETRCWNSTVVHWHEPERVRVSCPCTTSNHLSNLTPTHLHACTRLHTHAQSHMHPCLVPQIEQLKADMARQTHQMDQAATLMREVAYGSAEVTGMDPVSEFYRCAGWRKLWPAGPCVAACAV